LAELDGIGCIVLYSDGKHDLAWIRNFQKYQYLKPPFKSNYQPHPEESSAVQKNLDESGAIQTNLASHVRAGALQTCTKPVLVPKPIHVASPAAQLLLDCLSELGKSTKAVDVTYLEKAVKEYPKKATPAQLGVCVAWYDEHGKAMKAWGATFYKWCANKKYDHPDNDEGETDLDKLVRMSEERFNEEREFIHTATEP